jgi:UDP-3-O-[3-hydroxymyristoyl] glucosamine N-acyltransferase
MTLGEIAPLIGATIDGDPNLRITGLNGIKEAVCGDLTFYADARYSAYLAKTRAAALIVPKDFPKDQRPLLRVAEPYFAFAHLLQLLEQRLLVHPAGVHPTAVVAPSAVLGRGVALDAHVVVCDGAKLGDGVVLYAGVYVGRDALIGPQTIIYPNSSIRERVQIGARCVIHSNVALGSDGFGYAGLGPNRVKIPQIGSVILGDDVEVGSNSAIDRATTGYTTIGRGTKIDNLVQVGHNVCIGEHCAISGGVGIAGSARIGNNVLIGGQAGIGGHIVIGDGAVIAGRAGVHRSVPPGGAVAGISYQHEAELARKVYAAVEYLPDLLKRFRKLEKRVDALEE